MFEALKLPRRLQRHVANLSATVQVLLSEVILYAEGLELDANRRAGTEFVTATKTKKPKEWLNEQLSAFLDANKADDIAIAFCAGSGRSTRQIANFLGLEQQYVKRRLFAIRKLAEQHCPPAPEDEKRPDATVIEIFAEAQRR